MLIIVLCLSKKTELDMILKLDTKIVEHNIQKERYAELTEKNKCLNDQVLNIQESLNEKVKIRNQ